MPGRQIVDFAQRRLQPDAICHTDAFPSLSGLAVQATHIAKITPPEEADQWLPWVHIVIANLIAPGEAWKRRKKAKVT
ncbi:MAG: hypothetical protein WAK53_10445 [Chromatiaceae bacterium]